MKNENLDGVKKKSLLNSFTKFESLYLIIAVIAMIVIIAFVTDKFLTWVNILNLFKQVSIYGIASLGAFLVILMCEWDLSVGPMQGACGCFAVFVLNNVIQNVFVTVLLTMLLGAVIGLINGLLVTKAKINSFIATLGTMSIIKGATYVFTGAASVQNNVDGFDWLGTGNIFGLPVVVVFFIILCAIMYFVLYHTVFGRNVFAGGGNHAAAKASGINVDKIKTIAFVIAGALAALTAVITAARMDSGQPSTGTGFEMIVIAGVVLGGTSLTGGRGTILGCVLGIFILNMLSNALVLMNVSSFYQEIVRGIVIILAVYIDEKRRGNMQKRLVKQEKTTKKAVTNG